MLEALANLDYEVTPGTVANQPKEQADRAFAFSVQIVRWHAGPGKAFGESMNLLRNSWDWAWGQIIGEVPAEDALCEFDCRKP